MPQPTPPNFLASFSLSRDDLAAALAVLPELYAAADMTAFPRASLRVINRLIPRARFSSYNEIDLSTAAARVFFEPAHYEEEFELQKPAMWRLRHQHPIMRLYEQGQEEGVLKISDFLESETLHNLELYREAMLPLNVEDTLSFILQSSNNLKVFFAISGPQRFTERDRAIAAALQPHLVQGFENAIAFTDARALASLSVEAFRHGGHGLLLADRRGRIVHGNEQAARHLSLAFPGVPQEVLPAELHGWLLRHTPELGRPRLPLEIPAGEDHVTFRAVLAEDGNWMIATRAHKTAQLCDTLKAQCGVTGGEARVLLWLSRGKTNGEIAEIIGLSERTVAKHVQNIFRRLGVENRHSAMLRVRDVFG